ncbi:MAG: hypothetical protein JNL13_05545 [Chitinophagaceae bacterium]|nr:hypothetical protein [Chitinophagaceae bacterium]
MEKTAEAMTIGLKEHNKDQGAIITGNTPVFRGQGRRDSCAAPNSNCRPPATLIFVHQAMPYTGQ